MIKISHLRKEFPTSTPLKDVNVEIHKGDVIAIIGPSGTGKSTLIRCINRLEEATSGQIFIDGEEITAKDYKKSEIGRKVGMVFQHFNLFPHLTAVENVMIAPMDILGLSKDEAYKRAIELLRKVGLGEKGLNYPRVMSGGQKQRVAIARTLAMQPEIILLDEPTSALDPTMVNEVQAVIRDLAKFGTTMMIVTHEMKFAQEVANRVFYMDQGIIYEEGTPDEIFNHPKKERTRQFIQQLRVMRFDVDQKDYDFYGMNTEIEEFGRKHRMSQKMILKIQAFLEEMAVQIIRPNIHETMHVMIEYSEQSEISNVQISYPNNGFNPLNSTNELSLLLAKKAVSSLDFEVKEEVALIIATID